MGRRPWWATLGLVTLMLLLGGCQMLVTPVPPAVPTSAPHGPTGSPMPTLVPPTPTPSGLLPSLVAQADLGVPQGDAYGPVDLALDENGLGYVVSHHVEEPDQRQAALSVVDLDRGQVLQVWRLPGPSSGPLAAGAGRVYVRYEGDAGDRLRMLAAADGALLADIALDGLSSTSRLWIDGAGERLYLALADGVQVRNARDLDVQAWLPYRVETADRHAVLDLAHDRLYLALSASLYAHRLPDFQLVWQTQAPVDAIERLMLDASGEALVAQGRTAGAQGSMRQLLYYASQGAPLGATDLGRAGDRWGVAWANVPGESLVLYATSYPPSRPFRVDLWRADLMGNQVGETATYWGGTPLSLGADPDLYLLDQVAHQVRRLDGASLASSSTVTLGVLASDMVLESGGARLLVSDTAGRLHAFDASRALEGLLPRSHMAEAGSGEIVSIPELEVLLVGASGGDLETVSVHNAPSLSASHVITGGDMVAVDTRRFRAIVGADASASDRVLVWDILRGESVGAIERGGAPAYNPLRDEIYVAGPGVAVYDAGSLDPLGSLTPEIDARACPDCAGQAIVRRAIVRHDLGLLVLEMGMTRAGRGVGLLPTAQLFSLDSLEPVSRTWSVLSAWGSAPVILPSSDGLVYENQHYVRDIQRAGLVIRDAAGHLVGWRDGLSLDLLSPDGRLGYASRDGRWLALNTSDWQPVGYTERLEVHGYQPEADLYVASRGSAVSLVAPRWGEPQRSPAPVNAVIQGPVRSLSASPIYDRDRTLYAISEGALYRSVDGGASWLALAGGLPKLAHPEDGHLVVALSPTYSQDRTLYAGGWDADQGLGVWRSTDDGESWRPMWRGLSHLNVERLAFSAQTDQPSALWAQCRYDDLATGESGRSWFRAIDRGERWERVDPTLVPGLPGLAPDDQREAPLQVTKGGRVVQALLGGESGATLSLPVGERVVMQAQGEPDGALYVLASRSLYRSHDRGQSWERMGGAQPTDRFTALALVPGQTGATLFLGDQGGQVTIHQEVDLSWAPAP